MIFIKPNFWKKKNLIVYFLLPFTLVTEFINILKKFSSAKAPKIKTICVGNIYLGGTGKTPLVIKINEILKKKFGEKTKIKMINQKKSFLQRRFSSSILNSDEILNKFEEKILFSRFGL